MNKKTEHLVIIVLLLVFFAQGMANSLHTSLVFDEGPHLAIGYATLRTGDFRLQPVHIHPPLANVIAAALLLMQTDLPDPTEISGWESTSLSSVTNAVVWEYRHPAQLAVAGRTPMILAGVILAALVYRWAQSLGGQLSGLLALTLYAFDPNIIAHSALITTDIVVTLLSTATLYATTLYLNRGKSYKRRPGRLLVIGSLLGLTQLAKVSAIALLPVIGIAVFIAEFVERKRVVNSILFSASQLFFISLIAFVIVWAGYGFEVSQPPDLSFPIPASTHWQIYTSLSEHYQLGHPAYAFGRISTHGWWWYFPLAFLVKTPIPTLIFLLGIVLYIIYTMIHKVASLRQRKRKNIALIIWITVYTASSLFSSVNIGYRHLLPILPAFYICIGQVMSKVWHTAKLENDGAGQWTKRMILTCFTGLISWLAVGTLLSSPTHLEFFNEVAGGKAGGYLYLVDSNVDWGQSLWKLRDWMESSGVQKVGYAHYSPASLEPYGIQADFLPPDPRAVSFIPWHPDPGFYILGATVLQGVYTPDINTYAYFRSKTPIQRLGGALFVYKVEEQVKPKWAVTCVPEHSPDVIRKLLANNDLRVISIDCSNALVYPENSPGLYIIPPGEVLLESGYQDFDLKNQNGDIWSSIYRAQYPPEPEVRMEKPPDIDGPLDFIGYSWDTDSMKPGTKLQLTSYWRVREIAGRPLSLLAQLVTPIGPALSVGDGLGFPIEFWTQGDMIIQKHTLAIPDDIQLDSRISLLTGGYWLDTMERWTTDHTDNVIILEELNVE
jgi:hypothetical protein